VRQSPFVVIRAARIRSGSTNHTRPKIRSRYGRRRRPWWAKIGACCWRSPAMRARGELAAGPPRPARAGRVRETTHAGRCVRHGVPAV